MNKFRKQLKFIKNLCSRIYLFVPFYFNWFYLKDRQIRNLKGFEKKFYSQNGEDGIIKLIFHKIGTTNKYFVEFGVGDAIECNTKYLKKNGWAGVWMDCFDYNNKEIKIEQVTAENIEKIFKKYNVPKQFDLLSIDIDFNDYWVWKAIKNYSPRVVVIEYNSSIDYNKNLVVRYCPKRKWDGTNYFGASLLALSRLAKNKGYTLVGCDSKGVNAFFVRKDLIKSHFLIQKISKVWMRPKYGQLVRWRRSGHPISNEKMISQYYLKDNSNKN